MTLNVGDVVELKNPAEIFYINGSDPQEHKGIKFYSINDMNRVNRAGDGSITEFKLNWQTVDSPIYMGWCNSKDLESHVTAHYGPGTHVIFLHMNELYDGILIDGGVKAIGEDDIDELLCEDYYIEIIDVLEAQHKNDLDDKLSDFLK